MEKLTKEELIKEHKDLHRSLDRLAACYLSKNTKLLSQTTLMEFMEWSFKQTQNPECFNEE